MRRIVITGAAALAACGVLGMVPAAVQASSASAPTWTKQAPAAHPTKRVSPAMAYDAATGIAVLFGGATTAGFPIGGTWTWDGSTWTKHSAAVKPRARTEAAMAYDAATGTVVLFGGYTEPRLGSRPLQDDTWTWG